MLPSMEVYPDSSHLPSRRDTAIRYLVNVLTRVNPKTTHNVHSLSCIKTIIPVCCIFLEAEWEESDQPPLMATLENIEVLPTSSTCAYFI